MPHSTPSVNAAIVVPSPNGEGKSIMVLLDTRASK
jgi:hypothetical protein